MRRKNKIKRGIKLFRSLNPLFLYCRKVLLVGEISVQDEYGEPKIFLRFAPTRKS